MKKNLIALFSIIFVIVSLVGCSSKVEDELVAVHNDMKENVSDPLEKVTDTAEEKEEEVYDGSLSEEELIDFYEDEVLTLIQEKREYVKNMDEPKTDEAKEYYDLLTNGMNKSLDLAEMSIETVIALYSEDIDEDDLMIKIEEMEKLDDEIVKETDKIEKAKEDFMEEYNIEFEEDDEDDKK